MQKYFLTDRLVIRKVVATDSPAIFEVYASRPEATKYISWLTHRSVHKDTLPFVEYALQAWELGTDYTYMITSKDGKVLGSVGFINDRGKVAFGYILGPEHWGRGYVVEALHATLPYFAGLAGVFRLWACCDVDNVASKRVLEKAGLQYEGRIANWVVFPNQEYAAKDCHFFNYPFKL